MDKGERISRMVEQLVGENASAASGEVADHPFYRAYFQCWNDQRYYEAHDVLEQVWLNKDSADDDFFKGLIQAVGAKMGVNYGCDRVRFPSAVRSGTRVRGRAEIVSTEDVAGGVQVKIRITVEGEHAEKPACVADTLSRFYF
jgi:hypothetical protein